MSLERRAAGGAITREEILETSEAVIRRFGPSKAGVVDVARALGVSHASIYRHFATKAALRDAVVAKWLLRTLPALEEIARRGPAAERLRSWIVTLSSAKRTHALADPELFAAYLALAAEAQELVASYRGQLLALLAGILADGVKSGEFRALDADQTARAVMSATARFYDPVHAPEWHDPTIETQLNDVVSLIVRGLQVTDTAASSAVVAVRRARA